MKNRYRATQAETVILIGWKAIGVALGGVRPETARRWHRRRTMPITRESPGGPPMISVTALLVWQAKLAGQQ